MVVSDSGEGSAGRRGDPARSLEAAAAAGLPDPGPVDSRATTPATCCSPRAPPDRRSGRPPARRHPGLPRHLRRARDAAAAGRRHLVGRRARDQLRIRQLVLLPARRGRLRLDRRHGPRARGTGAGGARRWGERRLRRPDLVGARRAPRGRGPHPGRRARRRAPRRLGRRAPALAGLARGARVPRPGPGERPRLVGGHQPLPVRPARRPAPGHGRLAGRRLQPADRPVEGRPTDGASCW